MEESTKTKIGATTSVVFLVISLVMTAGLAGKENVYVCIDSETAMICDKLSKVNNEGLQTRCYFHSEEEDRDTYKICNSGWEKFQSDDQIKLNGMNMSDFVCDDGKLIKECRNKESKVLLRVKNG